MGTPTPIYLGPNAMDGMFGIDALKQGVDINTRAMAEQEALQQQLDQFRLYAQEQEAQTARTEFWRGAMNMTGTSMLALTAPGLIPSFLDASEGMVIGPVMDAERSAELNEMRFDRATSSVQQMLRLMASASSPDDALTLMEEMTNGLPNQAAMMEVAQGAFDGYEGVPVLDQTTLPPDLQAMNQQAIGYAKDSIANTLDEMHKAIEARDDPEKQPQQELWQSVANEFLSSAIGIPISAVEYPMLFVEQAANMLNIGDDDALTWQRRHVYAMRAAVSEMFPHDTARAEDFVTTLASGAGSYVGFMLGAYAAGPKAAAFLGAAAEASSSYRDAEIHGADNIQKFWALAGGSALGAAEALPIDRLFMRLSGTVGSTKFSQLLSQTTANSFEEFFQEFGQEALGDALARYAPGWDGTGYDPDRDMSLKQYLRAGGAGAILAAVGTGTVAATGAANDYTEAQRQQRLLDGALAQAEAVLQDSRDRIATRTVDVAADEEIDALGAGEIDAQVSAKTQAAAQAMAADPSAAINIDAERARKLNVTIANQAQKREAGEPALSSGLGQETVVATPPAGSNLPPIELGKPTAQGHASFIEATLSDEEIDGALTWYEDVLGVFEEQFEDADVAQLFAVAWLAAQQNASVSQSLNNVLLQAEQFARGVSTSEVADMKAGGLPAATAAVRDIMQGDTIEKGVGQKIVDFIDSALGRDTRRIAGDDTGAGAPFVIDIHSGRLMGAIDDIFLKRLRDQGYTIPEGVKADHKGGGFNGGKYEELAHRGRELTKEFNEMGWRGHTDLKPSAVQAVGWMAMIKWSGQAAQTAQAAVERNTLRVSFEVDGGEGSTTARMFNERLRALPLAAQLRVTDNIASRAWEMVGDAVGNTTLAPLMTGTGAWMEDLAPSAVGRMTATWDTTKAAANAIGWLLEQTEVLAHKLKPMTKNPKAIAIDIYAPGQMDRSALTDVFRQLNEGSSFFPGFSPVQGVDGREGIRMLVMGSAKDIAQARAFLTTGEGAAIIDKYDASEMEAEVYSTGADWTKPRHKRGNEYATAYRDITGRNFPTSLRNAKKRLQAELGFEITQEENRLVSSGEEGVRKYADAGTPAPVREDGLVELTHWSDAPRYAIDPGFAGTGPLRGEERANPARAYTSFHGVRAGQKGGYHKEGGLGSYKHVSAVGPESLYNMYEDPLGLGDDIDPAMSDFDFYDEMELRIRAAGFKGIWVSGGPHNQVALLYEEIVPESIVNEETGETFVDPDLDAATSGGREAFAEERSRAEEGTPAQPDEDTKTGTALADIAKSFMDSMKLTARRGRFTLKGADIMGQYSRKTGVARLRNHNDVSTLVHEGGHALNDSKDGALGPLFRQYKKDIIAVSDIYGEDLENASEKKKLREGFAEFFRLYVLEREAAMRLTPNLTKAFDDMLKSEDPDLHANMQDIGMMYDAYLTQGSTLAAKATVITARVPNGAQEEYRALRELGFGDWVRSHVNNVVQNSADRVLPARQMVSLLLAQARENGHPVDLKVAEDPAKMLQLFRNSGSRAMVQIMGGVMEHRGLSATTDSLRDVIYTYHGVEEGKSLRKIDTDKEADFATYVAYLRIQDEIARIRAGVSDLKRYPNEMTPGDVSTVVREMEAKHGDAFKKAAAMLHKYSQALLTKQRDAGLISDETYNDNITRAFYAPLMRDMSDLGGSGGRQLREAASGLGKVARSIHAFRGSDRRIIDPVAAVMQKTIAVERMIAQNEVKLAFAKLADKAGTAGSIVEHVPSHKATSQQVSIKDVAKKLTGLPEISEMDAADLLTILQPYLDDKQMMAVFGMDVASMMGDNIAFYWDKGKLKALQLMDGDVGFDVLNLIEGIGQENLGFFGEALALSGSIFRASITSWPDFLMVNFIRDQLQAWIATDVGFVPFASGLRGMYDEVKQTQWAKEYNAAFGLMGGINNATLHKARVEKDTRALMGKGYITTVFEPGFRGAAQGFFRLSELSETGTRFGIFRSAVNRGRNDGLTDWEAAIEASFEATDYMDFGLSGDKTLLLRRTIPFLNAQVQGMYKMWRTLGATEVARSHGFKTVLAAYFKGVNGLELSRAEQKAAITGRKAWIKMTSLSLLSAAIHYLFEDDEDYQNTSEYLRATGWVIPMGGEIVYIPKPFEWAMIANIVERSLEAADGDTSAKDRLLRGMMYNLSPPTSPPAIKAFVEHKANYSFFRDSPIIPHHMRSAVEHDASNAVNAYTSMMAKTIGEATGWPPMVVDHYLNSLGGSAARDMAALSNLADPNGAAIPWTRRPVVRRFFRNNTSGNTATTDFWSFMSYSDGSLTGAYAGYRNQIGSGVPGAGEQALAEMETEDEQAFAILNMHFSADEKRLHPLRRAQDVARVTSGMMRDLVSPLGLADTSDPRNLLSSITLTRSEKALVADALQNYQTREQRNALIAVGAEGWDHRNMSDIPGALDVLRDVNPIVADELERRLVKARVYDREAVYGLWDEARARLLADHGDARLSDLVTLIKRGR